MAFIRFMTRTALATSMVGLTSLAGLSGLAMAQTAPPVKIEGAWARATVQGQKGTGAFMKITAPQGAQLVGVSSPAAGVTEVHEMRMEGDVMKMRAVPALDLPAGKTVELKPGGYHVMLLDLKAPLAKDSAVPLALTFKDAKGVQSTVQLTVPVGVTPPGARPGAAAAMDAHKH